jgi:hypothetical protein
MALHAIPHFGIVLKPAHLPFEQFNRLIFDSVLVS